LYVNARHKNVCSLIVASNIASYVPFPDARVLDYGCGEALRADLVAAAAGELLLCEAAPRIRAALAVRFAKIKNSKIRVIGPSEMECLRSQSVDLIVLNGVIQYLTPSEADTLLAFFRKLVNSTGILIVGDVIPTDVGGLSDVISLLRLAAANGFLVPALVGLTRTLASDYTRLRMQVGLTRYNEAGIMAKLTKAHFTARRAPKNIGHHRARMTFIAQPA
jgi:ubiquinone/menaquinone biosynthesis C-methylase UbiE